MSYHSNNDLYDHDIDAANSFATKVIDYLRKEEIPLVPQNFELWYVYYANINHDLRKEIDALLAQGKGISEQDCVNLYEKYLDFGHEKETYQRAGDKISATLEDVSNVVQNVRSTTSAYTHTLKETTDRISGTDNPDDVKLLLDTIVVETDKMVAYNVELETRLEQSFSAMSDLKRDMERIRREAVTDGLTGLANRKAFDDQIAREVQESYRGDYVFSLLMIDIDHFKLFNDQYGHQVGDQVLRLVAKTLVHGVKGQDVVARYGGEEFVIILPDTNAIAAEKVAGNLRRAIEKKEIINRLTGEILGCITISVGVAEYISRDDAEQLIYRADKALYASKDNGRNRVTVSR